MRYFVEIHELQTELSVFEARGVANFGTRCICYVTRAGINQTVNDGVAHSKNPKECAYHVTFDLDFDLENTLDAGLPGDHRVQVWSRSSLREEAIFVPA